MIDSKVVHQYAATKPTANIEISVNVPQVLGNGRLDGGALLDEGHVTHGGDHNLSKNNFVTMFQNLNVDLPFE